MTVGELIEKLSREDPDLDVVIYEDTELAHKATVGCVEYRSELEWPNSYWYDVRSGGFTPKRGACVWLGC